MNVVAAVINYNSAYFLRPCLDGLLGQDFPNLKIVVVDNSSTDDFEQVLKEYSSQIHFIQMDSNVGFAAAANEAIRTTQSEYFLLMNPDVLLTSNYIENLVDFAESKPKGGSFTGKLLRFSQEGSPSVIDSTGHIFFRNRWVINRGEGEEDQGQFEQSEEVFGVCAAAALYRRTMLEDIKMQEEYLDETFFLYLEDVDLDWRARLKSWKAYYVPSAIGYHQRGYQNIFQSKNTSILRHCLKNRYIMMIKNDVLRDFLVDAWTIIPYEIMRFMKFFMASPSSLIGYLDFLKNIPISIKKRKIIQERKMVDRLERRSWIQKTNSFKPISKRIFLFLKWSFFIKELK